MPQVSDKVAVFTDGSAYLQDTPQFTISAGASILVSEQGYTVIDAQLVLGADHSSYRAEVWAILLTLQKEWAPQFFTDCSAVVELLANMILARAQGFPFILANIGTCGSPFGCTCFFARSA